MGRHTDVAHVPRDLDLANVRAFVVTAAELHFGRAAERLFLSQQGLSKRISRLEALLDVTLFVRGAGPVALTDAGRRFLPHAQRLIEHADIAAAASLPESAPPLRIDVWGPLAQPLRVVRDISHRAGELRFELSMRRSTSAAIVALQRDEIDAAFGNVHHLGEDVPRDVDHRLACFERVAVAVPAGHPLGGLTELTHRDLARHRLWWMAGGAGEVHRFLADFARAHDIALDVEGQNLGGEYVVHTLAERPDRLALYGASWPAPHDTRVRVVPLVDPEVWFPWSLLWRRTNRQPMLPALLSELPARVEPGERDRPAADVWTGLGAEPTSGGG